MEEIKLPTTQIPHQEFETLLLGGLVLFGVLTSLILYFVLAYRRRHVQYHREKETLQRQFETTLLNSKLEIGEATMSAIAAEIHDNIGQRLTLANINMHKLHATDQQLLESTRELIEIALQDLRDLSKSLHTNYVLEMGLELAIQCEVRLVCASHALDCTFSCTGETAPLSDQQEIILFRCVQELMNNSLKHSGATKLDIRMHQLADRVTLDLHDNGSGIDKEKIAGIGLRSVRDRISLLGGTIQFTSDEIKGTFVSIAVPVIQNGPES